MDDIYWFHKKYSLLQYEFQILMLCNMCLL